jgi:hypothetical protein
MWRANDPEAQLLSGTVVFRSDVSSTHRLRTNLQACRNEYTAIRSLDLQKTVVLISGGILEEHGPYVPSYTDGYADEAYARELANAIVTRPGWTVVMFPRACGVLRR